MMVVENKEVEIARSPEKATSRRLLTISDGTMSQSQVRLECTPAMNNRNIYVHAFRS